MTPSNGQPRRIGRYLLLDAFAAGGMATVHFGRQLGPAGTNIGRVVAIKRLHSHLASDPQFVSMFLDEARMAMRVRHPNVAPVLDVIADADDLLIVMEYVAGLPLSRFVAKRGDSTPAVPPRVTSAIVGDVLLGLHAAHEATSETGEPLGLVHRDVSPHNVLVGVEGLARLIDFGVARAAGQVHVTREASVKGKIAYMAPEQLSARPVSPRSDVYSASVILWELLAGRRLAPGEHHAAVEHVLLGDFDPPSRWAKELAREVDDVVMKGLAREPEARWSTAKDMAAALQAVLPRATALEVAEWLQRREGPALAEQADRARAAEATPVPSFDGPTLEAGRHVVPAAPLPSPEPVAVRRDPRRGRFWTIGLAFIALAGVAWGMAKQWSPAARATPATVSAVTTSAPSPSGVPFVPVASTPPASVASQPPAPSSLAAAAAVATPARSAAARTLPEPPKRRTRTDLCKVPYVIDESGYKRYNRACLP